MLDWLKRTGARVADWERRNRGEGPPKKGDRPWEGGALPIRNPPLRASERGIEERD